MLSNIRMIPKLKKLSGKKILLSEMTVQHLAIEFCIYMILGEIDLRNCLLYYFSTFYFLFFYTLLIF